VHRIRVVAMDKMYLIEVLEIRRLFGTKETKIAVRDLKPKLWDEIKEKLNFAGKY
jgi:hypothetical protein